MSQANRAKIEKLNGFERAWQFACRRSDRDGNPMSIVRTGLAEQPYRVTPTPEENEEVAAEVFP